MTDELREDDEGLDALRRAFTSLPAPSPVRELEAEDAATRRVVGWLAEALAAQAPASSAPPASLRPVALPRRVEFAWRPLAAAAVLLVLLGGSLLVGYVLRPGGASPAAPVAEGPSRSAPGPVVAAADDHLELRSGPVRMLLFLQPTPPEEEPR